MSSEILGRFGFDSMSSASAGTARDAATLSGSIIIDTVDQMLQKGPGSRPGGGAANETDSLRAKTADFRRDSISKRPVFSVI